MASSPSVKRSLPTLFVLVLALAVTWRTAHSAEQREQQRVQRLFDKQAEVRVQGVSAQAAASLSGIRSVASFLEASERFDSGAFESFAASILADHPDVAALEWAPRVQAAERAAFEREGSRALAAELLIHEEVADKTVAAGARAEYFPISHSLRKDGDDGRVGLDLASDPQLLLAFTEAGITDQTTSTNLRFGTGRGSAAKPTFAIVHPVHTPGEPITTLAERRAALAGFVVGELDVEGLVSPYLRSEASALGKFHWSVLDDGARDSARLLFGVEPGEELPPGTNESFAQVGKRSWRVLAIPRSGALAAAGRGKFWMVLLCGLIFSAASTAWFAAAMSRKSTIARLVEERTPELQSAKRTIEGQMAEMVLLNEQLQGRNRELREFSQAATFGIKKPLETLAARLDWARGQLGDAPPTALAGLQEAGSLVKHLRSMVDDLEELSTASSSAIQLDRVDLDACAERAVRELENLLRKHRASIRSDELPHVAGDQELITMLYRHLIENALVHAGTDNPVVHLTAERGETGWVLGVRDEGNGFRPGSARQPDKRARRGGHQPVETPGIGLAICDRVVTRHKGSLWVESEPGKGSHFRFSLGDDFFS